MSKHSIGDRVYWRYIHATNSRTRFERVKIGTVMGYVQIRDYTKYPAKLVNSTICKVKFDGNKTTSKIDEAELHSHDNA